jgi:hypothetical protein
MTGNAGQSDGQYLSVPTLTLFVYFNKVEELNKEIMSVRLSGIIVPDTYERLISRFGSHLSAGEELQPPLSRKLIVPRICFVLQDEKSYQ